MNVILINCINRSVKNKTPTEPNRISLKGLIFSILVSEKFLNCIHDCDNHFLVNFHIITHCKI